MAQRPLPPGVRVQLIVSAIIAVLCVLLAFFLVLLALAARDKQDPTMPIVVIVLVAVGFLALLGFTSWWLVRRVRRDANFRRRQLNGRAQMTVMIGILVAITAGNVAKAVIGVDGWAELLVVLPVGLVVLIPVMLLARRFDPRVRWFRRPEPLTPEEEQRQEEQRDAARRPDRPW